MKKVLSLVLAFAMILGSFGFVFANEFPDVKDSEYYGEAVNVLSSLGVIGGFPDGTFGPDKEVTRAQMATMIVNSLGMTVSGQSDTKFSDVPKSHWASGFIAYATSVGFVAGYPDGSFKPDAQVTYDQALTMIVAALGYKAESLPGNWPGNFVNKAQGLGILDTCKTTGTTNAPRQDIACFLYDALSCAIGYTDKDGTWHANDANGDGIGDDDMYGRLGAVNYRPAGKTEADGSFIVTGEEKSDLNLQKYMGAFVTAKASSSDRDKIVAVAEVKSEYIEGSFNTAMDKFTTTDDVVYKIDTTAAGKVQYGLSAGETLPYATFTNGDYDKPFAFALGAAPANTKLIMAVALSGSRITKVYSIQVWDTAANAGAGSFMLDEDVQESIKDDQKVGSYDLPMTDDDEIDTAAFTVIGDKTSLDDLAKDDVVTVYLNSDNKIARIEVSTKTIEGTVTKINSAKDEFTVGGEVYGLNGDSPKTPANLNTLMTTATEAKFYLDYAGDIFDYEEISEAATYYAILLETGTDTGRYAGSNTDYAKLFIEDGTVAEYEIDSKVAAAVKALANGTLVEYTIDDDVLIDAKATAAADSVSTTFKFDDNGVYGTNALTNKTKVFSFSAGKFAAATPAQLKDKDNWSVIEVSALKGSNVDEMDWFLDGGKYVAVRVSGVTGQTASYAIFASNDGTAKDGDLYTVLYEGKVQTMTGKNLTAPAPAIFTTATSISAYKLSFNSSDVITGLTVHTTDPLTPTQAAVVDAAGKTKAVTISGTMFTDAKGANYTMDKDASVYIYDISDKAWTAGTLNSMTGKTYSGIYLFKLGTGDFDLVLLVKP